MKKPNFDDWLLICLVLFWVAFILWALYGCAGRTSIETTVGCTGDASPSIEIKAQCVDEKNPGGDLASPGRGEVRTEGSEAPADGF